MFYLFASSLSCLVFFFFQAEDGIRDWSVTGVQTCALPIFTGPAAEQHQPAEGERVGVDHPFQPGAGKAERPLNVRQRDVEEGGVHPHHQLRGRDDQKGQAKAGAGGGRGARRGRPPRYRSCLGHEDSPPLPVLLSGPGQVREAGITPSCFICEKTSTTPHISAIRPPAKRKMKISLYVIDLPVGWTPMYSPLWVPVTEALMTTLSPSSTRSSIVRWRSGRPRRSIAHNCLNACAPVASIGNGMRISASGATTSSIAFEMTSTSPALTVSSMRLNVVLLLVSWAVDMWLLLRAM